MEAAYLSGLDESQSEAGGAGLTSFRFVRLPPYSGTTRYRQNLRTGASGEATGGGWAASIGNCPDLSGNQQRLEQNKPG